MSETLYRKYRPSAFRDVVGQESIVRTITNALRHNRIGQAYLLTGPRGTGKTTTARLLAKAATCEHLADAEPCNECAHCRAVNDGSTLDIIEIDAASHTGVDHIRELRDSLKLLPSQATRKVYIIDEVHMLSTGAFNALLKTLEEPPRHVLFILATTALHKVPETILSRCQRFDFQRLPLDRIVTKLQTIAKQEGVTLDADAAEMIALAAEGGLRDAESLLAQAIAFESAHITAESVANSLGLSDQSRTFALLEALGRRDLQVSLSLVREAAESGVDIFVFIGSLILALRNTLLLAADPSMREMLAQTLPKERLEQLATLSDSLSAGELVTSLELLQAARNETKDASIPELPLELALVKFLSESIPSSLATPRASTGSHTAPSKASAPITKTTGPQQQPIPENTPLSTIEEAPATPSKAPEASLDIAMIHTRWSDILSAVSALNSSLALTLRNASPLRIEASMLMLGVKFPMYREKLNLAENRLTIEQALDRLLGTRLTVKALIESADTASYASAPSSENHSIVAEALDILGGTVVESEVS